jgi:hypothetical protein
MPTLDAQRIDRMTSALKPDLFAALIDALMAVARGEPTPTLNETLTAVAREAHRIGMSPEDTLVAVRSIGRSLFAPGTTGADRLEARWLENVRVLMQAYFASESKK